MSRTATRSIEVLRRVCLEVLAAAAGTPRDGLWFTREQQDQLPHLQAAGAIRWARDGPGGAAGWVLTEDGRRQLTGR